jgi:hypothetical protein
MKLKNKWLDRRVAKPGPYLSLCLTEKELHETCKRITPHYLQFPEYGATCFQLAKEGDIFCVIALSEHAQKNNSAIEVAGMLVHEAVHTWQYYAEKMGETRPGDEQEAYAIQAISRELLAEYARRISE